MLIYLQNLISADKVPKSLPDWFCTKTANSFCSQCPLIAHSSPTHRPHTARIIGPNKWSLHFHGSHFDFVTMVHEAEGSKYFDVRTGSGRGTLEQSESSPIQNLQTCNVIRSERTGNFGAVRKFSVKGLCKRNDARALT